MIKKKRKFFLFFLVAFLVEFLFSFFLERFLGLVLVLLFSYFLVFFYKFPSLVENRRIYLQVLSRQRTVWPSPSTCWASTRRCRRTSTRSWPTAPVNKQIIRSSWKYARAQKLVMKLSLLTIYTYINL